MRLVLWVLLVTLVTLLSSSDASSTTNSDKKLASQLESSMEITPRILSVDYESNNKRSLRGESKKTETDEDGEERAIFVKYHGSIQNLKDKLRALNPFSTKSMEKRFAKLAAEGNTPDDYKKLYQIGTWSSRHWNRRLYEKYTAWYRVNYPNWRSSLQ
ncbi:hypothetical protein PF005_g22686 [Phytophthora fragariae]|uniref:RxLR effector protein n=1 Tax=Phytophthora fragariae TaxID=53985 RepID=A0A6A3DXF7_9STRA|nr:hypothetical protein PF003_g1843 [Phytophthora fragariae]KAE8926412.1 hypothetical protein PF009_g23398 [Phytophthora fragariae]KAE9081355.1 hypothetical protein PF007_g22697 [Phytophthora fragariae]KAE9105005.1 hypothetical protein PF006_g21753 [Phytophthora fragariae]KAE9181924.1 hypothetical protein PF005_g22686 [Phytophthora fragariae]